MIYTRRETCRVCAQPLIDVLDLGEHYLSGFHKPGADKGPKVPLVLTRCSGCELVQLRDTTNPDLLFASNYWYQSGINETMRAALADIAHEAEQIVDLQPGDCVLDIGANDGTLLTSYTRPEIVKVACEPATNLQPILNRLQVEGKIDGIIRSYFSAPAETPTYKIVTAIACAYDLDDPLTFLRDVKKVLMPDGLFVVQMSYLGALFTNAGYDTICHEHLETWSSQTFQKALASVGLRLHRVSYNDVNGGSARYFITHPDCPPMLTVQISRKTTTFIRYIMEPDDSLGDFSERTMTNRDALVGALYRLKRQGAYIMGLGASTKFNTVLQYCEIGPDLITAIADRDPRKHGLVTPTNIMIISEEEARAAKPDVFVLGAWQFQAMLREREAEFLKNGGRFLVPFPYPHFVGAKG